MKLPHSLRLSVGALLGMSLFSSCYFNSAGHIVRAASYNAVVDVGDLKADTGYVYCDGSNYYVELMRYRFEKPVTTQYSVFDEDKTPKTPKMTPMEKQMYRIDADFADYLTGKSNSYGNSRPVPVSESKEDIAARCTTRRITRSASSSRHDYRYSSPAAFWLYTAAGFDWLCVDLPMTCVENSLVIAGAATVVAWEVLSWHPSNEVRNDLKEVKPAMRSAIEENRTLAYYMEMVRSRESADRLAPVIRQHYANAAHYESIVNKNYNRIADRQNELSRIGIDNMTSAEIRDINRLHDEYESAIDSYRYQKRRLDLNDYYGSQALMNVLIRR